MLNKIQIIGHLGRDPETRETSGGVVANVNVATTERWNNKSGEKQERTEWHRCVFFGRLAEIVNEYLKKGALVYVEGRIETNKWQDKDGNDRYTTQIVAREMKMLGGRGDNDDRKDNWNADNHGAKKVQETYEPGTDDLDGDIPF